MKHRAIESPMFHGSRLSWSLSSGRALRGPVGSAGMTAAGSGIRLAQTSRGEQQMSLRSLNRRRFLASTALGAAALAAPSVLRAQGAPVKVGILQPISGAMSYSGQQGRIGATLALDEINASGIKSLGGAKIEPVFGDAQSTPEGGNAEVEKMNGAGCAAVVGGYVSSICLAASQTAARYDLPYIVDVGVAESIVTRGLKNTFRFGPGFGVVGKAASG